jgi:hypothetical protein
VKRTDGLKLPLIAVLLAVVLALLVAILGTTPRAVEAQQGEKAIASETVEAACLMGYPASFAELPHGGSPTLSNYR